MSIGASATPAGRLRERLGSGWATTPMVPTWSPVSARRAVRATIVMPALFALALKGFGNLQMALFAGFGSFAALVLVTFAGTRRDKLLAHAGLAVCGSVLLVIGTAVNSSVPLAVAVTVPVTFAVFFAGVSGPNAASAVTGALVAFVLPAASPGTLSMVPDRLAGWWMASVAATIAVLALPSPSIGDRVRGAVARLAGALADLLEAMAHGEPTDASLALCLQRKGELLTSFTASPFRPTGLALRDQALANAVELLEWCTALIADSAGERSDLSRVPDTERDLTLQSAGVLRDAGELFAGGLSRPDLEGLEQARERSRGWLTTLSANGRDFVGEARASFHGHAVAVTALAVGTDALVAARQVDAAWIEQARARWSDGDALQSSGRAALIGRYAGTAARHATVRSVWLVNSLRGACVLAAAVAVADLSSVQHGFWVVLGTLSVLRTNAAATGATALRALLGTAIGFGIGGGLLLVLGTSGTVLWVALPVAVFVAAYAPGAAPFALGQAAFTVTVAVLFNLLVPVGWKVGELRLMDVALGCLVSVSVGSLFWPRGVAPLVGDDLADAYRAGAAYLREAVQWVCGLRSAAPDGASAALSAGARLDEALRGFLAEQGTKHIGKEELWRLIGGTLRLRLTAHAVALLPRACAGSTTSQAEAMAARTDQLVAWYEQLAAHLGRPRGGATGPLPKPVATFETAASTQNTIWLEEHLDHLTESLDGLVAPAVRLAEIRRRPWWR